MSNSMFWTMYLGMLLIMGIFFWGVDDIMYTLYGTSPFSRAGEFLSLIFD